MMCAKVTKCRPKQVQQRKIDETLGSQVTGFQQAVRKNQIFIFNGL